MTLGGEMLRSAEAVQAESVTVSRHSNTLRKTLNQLRVQMRTLPQGDERAALAETIDLFAEEIPLWQQQAASLRERGIIQRNRALTLLETGYRDIWQAHIRSTEAIKLADSGAPVTGHNTQIRSVHPSKLNMNVAAGDKPPAPDMSIAVPAVSGQNFPEELDLRSFQISR
jgi:hypothetical protein